MSKATLPLAIVLIAWLFTGCTTYMIPMDSFRKQFGNIDSSGLRQVRTTGLIPTIVGDSPYLVNYWKIIHCEDKDHHDKILLNSPSIEIRFTHGAHHRKTVFYFDTIFLTDSTVSGLQSRFITKLRKTLYLNSITKTEVQDGHKQFKYTNP